MEILDSFHPEPPLVRKKLEYAGFWVRLTATIFDLFVLAVLLFILAGALRVLAGNADLDVDGNGSTLRLVTQVILAIAGILYFAIMESSRAQGSVGKLVAGIKVGRSDGERISFPHAIMRCFLKILSCLIVFFGYFMITFDRRKQGLHDKLSKTFVYYR